MDDSKDFVKEIQKPKERLSPNQTYTALCNFRNTETTLRWTRAQLFIALNSAAIAAVPIVIRAALDADGVGKSAARSTNSTSYGLSDILHSGSAIHLLLLLSIVMVALSSLWIAVTKRANEWVDYWTERLRSIECNYIPNDEILNQEVFGNKFEHISRRPPSFHNTLITVAYSFTILWTLSIIFFGVITIALLLIPRST